MSSQNEAAELRHLIATHQGRLRKLQEQSAIKGVLVDPSIPLEIAEIESTIAKLELELARLEGKKSGSNLFVPTHRNIAIDVHHGDITKFEADVIALKFAQALYGADAMVVSALGKSSDEIREGLTYLGQYKIYPSLGRVKSDQVLFLSVPFLYRFDYQEIRKFAIDVLVSLCSIAPKIQHLAMTMHGVEYGLNEEEALRSQIAGYFDALEANYYPPTLERITIVEKNKDRAQRLSGILTNVVPGKVIPIAYNLTQRVYPKTIKRFAQNNNLDNDIIDTPRVYILIRSTPDVDDLFYYGIRSAVQSAGYICERADLTTSNADTLEHIKSRIEAASLVIADLTNIDAHVLLALGYAWGKSRSTILLKQETTKISFDIHNQRCITYNQIRDLEENLARELQLSRL
jgi:hypothetical protein